MPKLVQHPTTAVVVWWKGKLLLVKRGHAPERGSWAVPGGHVERGETAAAAAQREMDEEVGTGAVRVAERPFFVFTHDAKLSHRHVAHAFRGRLVDARKLRAGSDAASLRWWDIRALARAEQARRLEVTHYTKRILNWLWHGEIRKAELRGRWKPARR